jgi:hypothetical protein
MTPHPDLMLNGEPSERINRMERMRARLGLLFVLMLLLGSTLAHARPIQDQSPAAVQEPKLMERAWGWLASVFERAGSFIDPLGGGDSGHSVPSGQVQTDGGSFIDPLGLGGGS